MTVSRWGNSLAVRLPASVVESLGLKEGDEVEIGIVSDRKFNVGRGNSREKAIETIRRLSRPLPAGFKFDREEINER